jgi:hypothetical protein
MNEKKVAVESLKEMRELTKKGIIQPTFWEWFAMYLIEANRRLDKDDKQVIVKVGMK